MTKKPPLDIEQRPAGADLHNVDLSEKGRGQDGEVISSDRRLYMQFMAFGDCAGTSAIIDALEANGVSGALYEDVNDPRVSDC